MSQNVFQSEKLLIALDNLEAKAESLSNNIDVVSGEIKDLEGKLQNLKLPFAAEIKVAESAKLTREEAGQTKIYAECSFRALEFLKWEKEGASGKFRLLYQRIVESEEIPGLSIDSLLRPLIECPVSVRLKMHPHLDKLVDTLSEHISL